MDPTDDEDRTISKPARAAPGALDALTGSGNSLPPGTRVGELEIRKVIGEGGFGIVYLAWDHSLAREVALKEYMPVELAARTREMSVSVRSERHAETFAAGLRSFVNEARLLAQFDHPSLLKVYRFWEDHGTAYMLMPYVEGVTLKRALTAMHGPPDEAWLKTLLKHLLDGLERMHEHDCFHRDIAPDNILILNDRRPLLLDFGAARRVIRDMQRTLTVILKPGYAPVEQYGEMPDMEQGAWTDLYALAAVVHYCIMRRTPPQAVARYLNDKYEPLASVAGDRYSQPFLRAIDAALAVRPGDRPQTVAEMRALLGWGDGVSRPRASALAGLPMDAPLSRFEEMPPTEPTRPEPSRPDRFEVLDEPRSEGVTNELAVIVGAVVALVVALALVGWFILGNGARHGAISRAAPLPEPGGAVRVEALARA